LRIRTCSLLFWGFWDFDSLPCFPKSSLFESLCLNCIKKLKSEFLFGKYSPIIKCLGAFWGLFFASDFQIFFSDSRNFAKLRIKIKLYEAKLRVKNKNSKYFDSALRFALLASRHSAIFSEIQQIIGYFIHRG